VRSFGNASPQNVRPSWTDQALDLFAAATDGSTSAVAGTTGKSLLSFTHGKWSSALHSALLPLFLRRTEHDANRSRKSYNGADEKCKRTYIASLIPTTTLSFSTTYPEISI